MRSPAPLGETNVTLALLDELAAALDGDRLRASLRWVAAGCTVRGLARDVERAAIAGARAGRAP